jgi:hypothetical protein
MPLSTTHSTCSGILSLAQLSGSSDQMRRRNGAAQPPPHDAEPLRPISAETAQLDNAGGGSVTRILLQPFLIAIS